MRQIVLRPQAQDDIDKIWDYSAEQWDMDQADAYVGDIRAAIRFIATSPFIGTDCAHLARGLRKLNSGSHAIFYLHGNERIDIVRILHQRADHLTHLE